ncbi:MAG: RDD family protein [Planctomycetota bacterium]
MNEVVSNLASRWKRLGGALIDGLLATAIIIPIMLATGVLQRAFGGEGMTIGEQVAFFIVGWVVFLILNGYLLLNRGQTMGKVAMKTKIVDLSGNLPNFGKILGLRYLILALVARIPFVGSLAGLVNALCIFGKERRCLHDYLAGTRVVEA